MIRRCRISGLYYIKIIRLDAALFKFNVYVKSVRAELLQRRYINGIHQFQHQKTYLGLDYFLLFFIRQN
jgi:hypothetical protein